MDVRADALIGPVFAGEARQALLALADVSRISFQATHDQMLAVGRVLATNIDQLLGDAATLRNIAEHSYRHDNGFLKIVFPVTDPVIAEVRLHAWQQAGTDDANIHNHSADFVSMILCGGLVERHFAAPDAGSTDASAYQHFACGTRSLGQSYTMRELGQARLTCTLTEQLPTGTIHALRHDVLHRIHVSQLPTMTLFIQGHRKVTGTDSYLGAIRALPPVVDSPMIESARLRSFLASALQMLPSD